MKKVKGYINKKIIKNMRKVVLLIFLITLLPISFSACTEGACKYYSCNSRTVCQSNQWVTETGSTSSPKPCCPSQASGNDNICNHESVCSSGSAWSICGCGGGGCTADCGTRKCGPAPNGCNGANACGTCTTGTCQNGQCSGGGGTQQTCGASGTNTKCCANGCQNSADVKTGYSGCSGQCCAATATCKTTGRGGGGCASNEYTDCYNGDSWCFSSAGVPQRLLQDCQDNSQRCSEVSGTCINCQSHAYKECWYGNSWWFDSCKNPEEKIETCTEGCENNGECCHPSGQLTKKCYVGEDVYWVNSCGTYESVAEDCQWGCSTGSDKCFTENQCAGTYEGCNDGDVWLFNGCRKLVQKVKDCGSVPCYNGKCDDPSSTTQTPVCGNGKIDSGEICDPKINNRFCYGCAFNCVEGSFDKLYKCSGCL